MKIITIANKKGGCGKTTVTCLLAIYWAEKRKKQVAVKDFDQQGSTARFIKQINHSRITAYSGGENFDYVLVDTPGGIEKDKLNELVNTSDLVIVPMLLSPVDIRATRTFADAINEPEKTRILFNLIDTRRTTFNDRKEYADAVGLSPLRSYLGYRSGYTYALGNGWIELNKKCVEELGNLAKEIG